MKDVETIAKKVVNMKVFEDATGTFWKQGVKEAGGEILCVSQFTLMAKTSKGNKPDFHDAMVCLRLSVEGSC